MPEPLYLKGVKAGRFVFLLEQGFALKKAAELVKQNKLVKDVMQEIMLTALESRGDQWLYETVKQENLIYSSEFFKAFCLQADWGRSLDDALEFAQRKADNAAAFAIGEGVQRPSLDRFTVQIRLVMCKANRAAFTDDQVQMILFKLWRKARKGEDSELPHFVECTHIPGSGHIRLICTDKKSVNWLTQNFSRMELWPGASICLMREKKFLETEVFSVSLPDSASDDLSCILNNLQNQNDGTDTSKWTVLTRQLHADNTTVELLTLMPLVRDRKPNEDTTFELNYKASRVKFTPPKAEETQVAFHATFPESARMSTEAIFKRIERDNDGHSKIGSLSTSEWKFMHRREGMLNFYVDAKSAETIKNANYEIYFKFKKVKFIPATWKDRGAKAPAQQQPGAQATQPEEST